MTRLARAITTLHGAVFIWLAYLTVRTWGATPIWVSILNTAASLVSVIAAVRESEHADTHHYLRAEVERVSRPDVQRPADDARLTLAEEQAFAEIKNNYRKSAS